MRCYQRGQESFVLVSMLQTKLVLVEVFVFKQFSVECTVNLIISALIIILLSLIFL